MQFICGGQKVVKVVIYLNPLIFSRLLLQGQVQIYFNINSKELPLSCLVLSCLSLILKENVLKLATIHTFKRTMHICLHSLRNL
jgi:hypothetical protein